MSRWLLVAALIAASAVANAQILAERDIDAQSLLAGEADEPLRRLGQRAALDELVVSVTAPSHWQPLIAEQIQIGAGRPLEIRFRDTFVENAVVRISAGAIGSIPTENASEVARETSAAEEPVLAEQTAPVTQQQEPPAPVEREPVAKPIPRDSTDRTELASVEPSAEDRARASARVRARERNAGVPPVAAQPVAAQPEPQAQPVPPPASATTQTPVSQSEAANPPWFEARVRELTEQILERRELADRLRVSPDVDEETLLEQLEPGDQVFLLTSESLLLEGVGARQRLVRLDRRPDVRNGEWRQLGPDRFELVGRSVAKAAAEPFMPVDADNPAVADERTRWEELLNSGRSIQRTLRPVDLRQDDLLYVGDQLAVVIRRGTVSLDAYWLSSEIDLADIGLEPRGEGKYRIRRRPRS